MEKIKEIFKNKTMINILIPLIILLIYFGVLVLRNGILYYVNDDIAMKTIVSGVYSDRPYAQMIFSGFPYSLILVFLYTIIPQVDWYGTVLLGLIFLYAFFTIYFIIKEIDGVYNKVVCTIFLVCFLSLMIPAICVFLTFTKVSIFIISCSLILYLLPDNKVKNIIIAFGIIMSYAIRDYAAIMILGFFVPALIYKTIRDKSIFKKDFLFGVTVGILLIVCTLIDNLVIYHYKGWDDYFEYTHYRALFYDYYHPLINNLPLEEKERIYYEADITGDELILLENYNMALDTKLPSKLPKLIQVCKDNNIKPILNIVESAEKLFIKNREGIIYLISILVIILILAKTKNRKEFLMKILPFMAFQILICAYLVVKGRIIERVYCPLFFCIVSTNIYIIFNEINENIVKIVSKYENIIMPMLGIAISICFCVSITRIYISEPYKLFYKSKEWMNDYLASHQENFYLYNRSNAEYYYFFNKYDFKNYINMGGWTSFTPLDKIKLEKRNASCLMDLLYRDNVYLVASTNVDVNFYRFLDDDMIIERIDQVNEYIIYKFRKP